MMRMHMKRWAWQSGAKTPAAPEQSLENNVDGIGDMRSGASLADPLHRSNDAPGSFSGEEEENHCWNRPGISTTNPQTHLRRSSDGSDGLDISDKENQTDHPVLSSPVRLSRPSPLAAANTFWTSSSPRQSFSPVEGIQKLGTTPTGSLTAGLDANRKRSDFNSSPLCPLEEVTLSSSSEEILPMRITQEQSKLQQERILKNESAPSLGECPVANKLNWSDPRSNLHLAYQSLSSPTKSAASSQKEERKSLKDTITTTDPFEWAYAIWRRKGLLPAHAHMTSEISRVSSSQEFPSAPNVSRATSQDDDCNKVGFISPRSQSTKPWNNDQKKFSNILEKWKSQTEKQPLSSPGSCTVLQAHHLSDASKTKTTGSTNGIDSAVRVLDLRATSRRKTLHVVERIGKHPSSSVPLVREASPPRDVKESTRSSPKSQAWKLKTARDLRMLQEKHLKRDEGRNIPKHGRQFVELKACDEQKFSSSTRSTSQPRSMTRDTRYGASMPTDDCPIPPRLLVAKVDEPKTYNRAKSQPRSFRRNTIALCDGRVANTSFVKEPLRVCDLEIDETHDGSFDVPIQISCVPLEERNSHGLNSLDESTELFSPYTQRVMRNLAKVYDASEDVKTPRGSDSHHPWQHDRLLQRVDSLTESSSGELSCRCSCANSVFTGNDDMVEFFLPLMGSACSCGNKSPGLIFPEQPTSLVNILRPWQVSFLGRFGIYTGEELVKSFHRSGAALAKALQQYRKKQGMTPFPLKSCVMALQIWSKTSKTFVRSIRDQLSHVDPENNTSSSVGQEEGLNLKVPNTLYLLSSFMDKMPSEKFMLQSPGNISNDTPRPLVRCLTTSP